MKLKLRNLFDNQDGQAVAELALALPVLLLVVLAIVDFGRFMNYWNDENHVANLGARAAAVGSWPQCNGSTQPTLEAYIRCEAGLDSPNLTGANTSSNGVTTSGGACISISVPTGTIVGSNTSIGVPVTVTVKARYGFLPWLGAAPASGVIKGTATMRLEQPLAANVTNTQTCSDSSV
jgi:Flp pilus assembly protein TadG